MNNRKLTNIFIYPQFQFVLLLAHIIVSAATIILIRINVSSVFNRLSDLGKKIQLPQDHAYYNFIQNSQNMMEINLNWVFGFSILLTVITSLYLSHKVVGPIQRLRSYFKNMAATGRVDWLTFRRGDFFKDLPPQINEALAKIKK
jgi:hypothetical protein